MGKYNGGGGGFDDDDDLPTVQLFTISKKEKKKIKATTAPKRNKTHWLEVQVNNPDGGAMPYVACDVVFGDGRVSSQRTNEYGVLRMDGLPKADTYTIRFSELADELGAAVDEEAAITISKSDALFAPGPETLSFVYAISGLHKEKVSLEVTSAHYADGPIYKGLLSAYAKRSGTHRYHWEGKANCSAGELKGERLLTPLYSPYKLRLFTDSGVEATCEFEVLYHSVDMCQGPWTPEEVEPPSGNQEAWVQYRLNELGFYGGPVDKDADDYLKKAVIRYKANHPDFYQSSYADYDAAIDDDLKSALYGNEPARAVVKRNVIRNADAENVAIPVEAIYFAADDESPELDVEKVALHAERINRPLVPLEVKIFLQGKEGEKCLAPAAVGPVRVNWRMTDPYSKTLAGLWTTTPGSPSKTKKYIRNCLSLHDEGDGNNCFNEYGGLRDDGADDWHGTFMVGDTYLPHQVEKDEEKKLVHCAAYNDPDEFPLRLGRAGVLFRPSFIAGDSYFVEAAVDFGGLPNEEELAKNHKRRKLTDHSCEFVVQRQAKVAVVVNWPGRDALGLTPIDWDLLREEFLRTGIDLDCQSIQSVAITDVITEDDYKDLVSSLTENTDKNEITLSADQMYGVPMPDQGSSLGTEYQTNLDGLIDDYWGKIRNELAKKICAALRPKYGSGFIIVDYLPHQPVNFQLNPTLASSVENTVADYVSAAPSAALADGVIMLSARPETRSPHEALAHEIGHALWLKHYRHAEKENLTEHDVNDHNCIMSHMNNNCDHPHHRAGRSKGHFCGKCNLNLRGWDISKLPLGSPLRWVHQRLFAHDGQTPVVEQTVELITPSNTIVVLETDDKGDVRYPIMEEGEHAVRLRDDDDDAESEADDLPLVEPDGGITEGDDDCVLCGTLLDESGLKVLPNEWVDISGLQFPIRSDSDGYFEMQNVDRGEYKISVKGKTFLVPTLDAPSSTYLLRVPEGGATQSAPAERAEIVDNVQEETALGAVRLDWSDDCTLHQYSHRNLPADFLEETKKRDPRNKKRKLCKGEHLKTYRRYWRNTYPPMKPLGGMSPSEREAEVETWKAWREKHPNDQKNGSDACGPTSLTMVLRYWGESFDLKEVIAAKHTWAYHCSLKQGAPKGETLWKDLEHPWDSETMSGGYSDKRKKKFPFTRIDGATPAKLMALAERLVNAGDASYQLGYKKHLEACSKVYSFTSEKYSYQWAQVNPFDPDKFPFASDEAAETWLKEQLDQGIPVICSYVQGPCMRKKGQVKNQGSGGHYVVVVGYDDEQIFIADPVCASVEGVPKAGVSRKVRYKKKVGKKAKWVKEEVDIGFMAAWKRKGYRYLLVKSNDSDKLKQKVEDALKVPSVEAAADKKPEDVPRAETTFELPFAGFRRWQQILSELKRKDNSEPYYKTIEDGGELTVDGKWGKNSKAGLKVFQKDNGLKANGFLTKKTKGKLKELWREKEKEEQEAAAAEPEVEVEKPQPEFAHGNWSTEIAKFGSTVDVELDTVAIDDGTQITCEIWDKCNNKLVKTMGTSVEKNHVQLELDVDFADEGASDEDANKFYFVAKGGGANRKFDTLLKAQRVCYPHVAIEGELWSNDEMVVIDVFEKLAPYRHENYPYNYTKNKRFKEEENRSIKRVLYHHTAGSIAEDPFDGLVRVFEYHVMGPKIEEGEIVPGYGNGWPGIAYTIFVPAAPAKTEDGRLIVYQAWPFDWETWHAGGANTGSIGVVFQGYFHSRHEPGKGNHVPTKAQTDIARMLWEGYLKPKFGLVDNDLSGHFEHGKLACPGDVLEKLILDIRSPALA
jgi:hypothetical protein